jgi:hypothetical protein
MFATVAGQAPAATVLSAGFVHEGLCVASQEKKGFSQCLIAISGG